MRDHIEHGDAHRDRQSGRLGADPVDDITQHARAVVERAPIFPAARFRAQQFVEEVAVTMLEIDEVIADVARHLRRTHESGGDAIQLIVRQYVEAAGKAGVELWMRVGGERRRRALNRPGEAARMGQLQTDVEVVGGARSEPIPVLRHEHVP